MKKALVFMKKYCEEFISAELFCVMILLLRLYREKSDPENILLRRIISFFLLCAFVAFLWSVRLIWRKYKKKIKEQIRLAYMKLVSRLVTLLENIGVRRTRGNILSGKTTVSFDFLKSRPGKKPARKRVKWRQLEDDSQRLGYLYGRMIEGKIDEGRDIRISETPDEIAGKNTTNETEGELFSCYSGHRYYEKAQIDGENLVKIKEILGIK
jgi:hypothetical protein